MSLTSTEYPRNEDGFREVYAAVDWFTRFHNKPVWLIASNDHYSLSVIQPHPKDLARGTAANRYDVGMKIIETVYAEDFHG